MYFMKLKFLLLFIVVWNLFSVANAKEVCLTNIGKDPVAFIVGHSMQWVDPRRGRCINTNEVEALIQNIDVKDIAGGNFPSVSKKNTGQSVLSPKESPITFQMHLFASLWHW